MQGKTLPFQIVFISGAARSGTSIAHALICTSSRVNHYIGECSYFSQLIRAFDRGMETYDIHTRYYFDNQLHYADLHRKLLADVLTAHWQKLGRPDILVLKDPDMLPIIGSVAALIEQAKFVILYRDPRDVIASRVQVQTRRNPQGNFTRPDNIAGLAEEYASGYGAIEGLATSQPHRVFYQDYERLVQRDWQGLQKFLGLDDLDPALVWQNSAVEQAHVAADPWHSQLYFKPVSIDAIGSYQKTLDAETILLIERLCNPTVATIRRLAAAAERG